MAETALLEHGESLAIAGMPTLAPVGAQPQPWWWDCARALAGDGRQRAYPCHFGRVALERRELYATFFDDSPEQLADALRRFLDLSRPYPQRRLALAAFRRPDGVERDPEGCGRRFWELLRALRDLDERPWPDDIPTSPEDPAWEYSFHGVPMFIFAAAPLYRRRRSRHLGPGMVMLFQPRNVFDGIEGSTPAGAKARKLIRRRLSEWDDAPPHPDMGDYGDASNHEWLQYFLPDDDSRAFDTCPMGDQAQGPSEHCQPSDERGGDPR